MIKIFEEFQNKNSYTLYHSTNSDFFKKPEDRHDRYYNPLGTGIYFSSIKSYSKKFGKNTYVYLLPKNSDILFINKSNCGEHIQDIIHELLRGLELDWDEVVVVWNFDRDEYINRGDPPIGILNGFTRFIYMKFNGGYKEIEIQDLMEMVVNGFNDRYDAVWYQKDLYNGYKQDEIIIPFKKFKSEYFQEK